MARINSSVFAARKGKTLKCGKCGREIAKGERYLYWKPRSQYRPSIRCGRSECYPKQSETTTSKMAGVYAATETAQDTIASIAYAPGDDPSSFVDEIKSALGSAADEWRSVGDEYRDAAEASPTGMVFGVDYNEAADSIDSAADELTGWDPDEDEPNGDHADHATDEDDDREGYVEDCEECQSLAETWAEDTRQSALDLIDDQQSSIEVG